MKKLFAILMTVCMLAGMCTVSTFAANDAVVYLKAGGTGDGSSEANAAGTLPDAMAAAVAKTTDVKIQVVGDVEFDMTENYSSPLHTNKITISGKGTNGRLLVKNPLSYTIWYLKGALAFEHLEFNLSNNHLLFNADFNDLSFLDGITVTAEVEDDIRLYVRAADTTSVTSAADKYDGMKFTGNQKLEFRSGKFGDIVGYAQNGLQCDMDGEVYIYFGGTAVANNLTVFRASVGNVNNATVVLDGGEISEFMGFTDRPMSDMVNYRFTGPLGQFRVIITDKFDPTQSFTIFRVAGVFQGIAGSTIWTDDAKAIRDDYRITGQYVIKAEAGVYDMLASFVNTDSFDGEMEKINSGSGLQAALEPYPEINTQPSDPGQTPSDTDKPQDTSKPADKVTDAATKKPATTSKQTDAASGTSAVTAQPQAQEEGLNLTVVLIIIGAASAVAVAVVVIILVKKK